MDIGTAVTITSGIREGHEGTLALISGPVYFVEHAEIGLRPYYRDEISVPESGVQASQESKSRKTRKQSTRAVLRHLDKSDGVNHAVWQSLISKNTSQEEFERLAISHLGDKSDLKDSTIETADWTEVYNYYLEMLG